MRRTGNRHGQVAAVAVGVGLLAVSGTSFAIEEVVVSTRKLEENLQEVPIAVNAITAQTLQDRGVTDLAEVVRQSPSVILDQGFSPQDTRIVIRGLSPTRGRQNVAVLQDGVDVSSEALSATAGGSLLINPRLFDLERVEIVKGPAVALYGRSAFAGAINYITRAPGDEFDGAVATELGNQGQQQFQGRVSGPLTDSLSGGVSGMIWSRDGFYTNERTGQEMGEQEGLSLAGTLRWRPVDSLDVKLRVESLNDEFGVTPFAVATFNRDYIVPNSALTPQVIPEPIPSNGFTPEAPRAVITTPTLGAVAGFAGEPPSARSLIPRMSEDPRTCTAPNQPTCQNYAGTNRDIIRGTLTVDWDLGPVLFTSLSHVADADTTQREGAEDVSNNLASTGAEFYVDTRTKLYSQEFRLSSDGDDDDRIKWVAGAQLWRENGTAFDGSYTCLNYAGFVGGPCGPTIRAISASAPLNVPGDGLTPLNADKWVRYTEHYSAYFLADIKIIDTLRLTLEGRQTWEDNTVRGPDQDNGLFDPSGNLCTFFGGPPCPSSGPGTNATTGLTTVANARGDNQRDSFFAPKITLTWAPADDVLLYATFAETFKPKGISTLLGGTGAFFDAALADSQACEDANTDNNPETVCDPIAGFRFDQEKLDHYEIGWKTDWLDRRLRVNGAVFYDDFKNKQVSTQVPVTNAQGLTILSPRILNAGQAEVLGAELEVIWQPLDGLTLSGSYTWLDTEYTEYTQKTSGAGRIAYQGNCTPQVIDRPNPNAPAGPGNRATVTCEVDYSGNELEGAPENAFFGNVRYEHSLVGGTDWFVEADAIFQDQRFSSDDNQMIFPDYWLANFRAGIRNEQWDVLAYVDNAFDNDDIKTGFSDGDIPTFFQSNLFLNRATVTLPDPRLYGIRVNYRFGKN
jgi:outer membrane receptor protein involved in Fe transport